MKIEKRIHANCSEWDSEVENDYEDYSAYTKIVSKVKEDAIKEVKKEGWDK